MKDSDSVTLWLQQLKAESPSAAQNLWETYFQQMVNIARQRLPRDKRQVADEEDAALSAFKSFCRGVQQGRFEQLVNRESLWPLLVAITMHKTKDQVRFLARQRRGGQAENDPLWENILSQEPTPEIAMQLSEQLESRLADLDSTGDSEMRDIVLYSLEGYTTTEIGEKLDCTARTVQRKLKIIRRLWIDHQDE